MPAGKAGQLRSGGHDQGPPRQPVLEIEHRMVSEVELEHVPNGLWVEEPGIRDQGQQFRRGGCLACAEGAVQPDDHLVMLRPRSSSAALRIGTGGWAGLVPGLLEPLLGTTAQALAARLASPAVRGASDGVRLIHRVCRGWQGQQVWRRVGQHPLQTICGGGWMTVKAGAGTEQVGGDT
jgi:hypothetical protein